MTVNLYRILPKTAQEIKERIDLSCAHSGKFGVQFIEWDAKRSNQQNALSYVWYECIENQKGDITALEARCESKLHCGVPLLQSVDVEFRDMWQAMIKDRYSYEEKLKMMEFLPVTSRMKVKTMSLYFERMISYWERAGIKLDFPNWYDPKDYREVS